MDTKDIILKLRTGMGMSQEELAGRVFVTRQAVSRWENGDTVPNTETLKLLSGVFDVSINTLLGSPRRLICQCCGMPLDDTTISREPDGRVNEEYCKWCYADGRFVYHDMDELIGFLSGHMADVEHSPQQLRRELEQLLPRLNHWQRYAGLDGAAFEEFKLRLIDEINALNIDGMPGLTELHLVSGKNVNHTYRLTGGCTARFLDDEAEYLSTRVESEFGGGHFGAVAGMDFLLVYACDENEANPELLAYKRR